MKNCEKWEATKFVYKKGKLIGSRDERYVTFASRLVSDLIAKNFDEAIKLYAKGKLVDLGCGGVPLYGTYKPFVDEVVCADYHNDNQFLDLSCDLNKELPFEDGAFDTVILSDVLEHIYKPFSLMEEIHRIMKPGAHLMMSVPFMYWIHGSPYDYHRYTENWYEATAKEIGFEIVGINRMGGGVEVLTDHWSKIVAILPRVGKILSEIARFFCVGISKTKIGKKVIKRTSGMFTLEYFVVYKKK